jgi:hypothetical protein
MLFRHRFDYRNVAFAMPGRGSAVWYRVRITVLRGPRSSTLTRIMFDDRVTTLSACSASRSRSPENTLDFSSNDHGLMCSNSVMFVCVNVRSTGVRQGRARRSRRHGADREQRFRSLVTVRGMTTGAKAEERSGPRPAAEAGRGPQPQPEVSRDLLIGRVGAPPSAGPANVSCRLRPPSR